MNNINIPFKLPGFEVTRSRSMNDELLIEAKSVNPTARCPECLQASVRVHSYYRRKPQDLPVSEWRVSLHLTVRRFRCPNPACPQQTFAERLPEVVPLHAQRTSRLLTRLRHVGFALGGEAGTRHAKQALTPASADTLLRLIRRAPSTPGTIPSVLGVDDWAWRKGQRYGTILVDLEARRAVELLPDRTAETLADWLRAHPGVRIISRDRSTEYSRGATLGAPEAVQVADRWHLLQNLREALERTLSRCHAQLRVLPLLEAAVEPNLVTTDPQRPYRRGPRAEQRREEARQRRYERYQRIKTFQAQGMNILQIATQLKMSRTTVRAYFNVQDFPERIATARGRSILDPYQAFLHARWQAGCHNGVQLWREILAQGFPGSRKLVAQWVRARRASPAASTPKRYLPNGAAPELIKPVATTLPAPRRLVWLLLTTEADLDHQERLLLRFIRQDGDVAQAYELAQRFLRLVRQRTPEALSPWLAAAIASSIPELVSFAEGLQREYDSIEAALRLPWSQGQTEGQVNRLKTLKRQMYGRANFDLLRQRFLHTA